MLFVAALMSAGSMNAAAVVADGEDSLHIEQMQEVVVKGVKAQKDAPFAIANVAGKDLQSFSKTGRELPFLFSQTPGGWLARERYIGRCTDELPRRPVCFLGQYEQLRFALGRRADTARRGNVYQWRRRFWRYGGLNVKISFGNSVARAVYFIRLVQHI